MVDNSIFTSESFYNMVDTSTAWIVIAIILIFIARKMGIYSHPLKLAKKRLLKVRKSIHKTFSHMHKANPKSKTTIVLIKEIDWNIKRVEKAFNVYLYDDNVNKASADYVLSKLKEVGSLIKEAAHACYEDNKGAIPGIHEKVGNLIKESMEMIDKIIAEESQFNSFTL
ncbi:MAG: hypothetical protein J6R23_05920 [Spirochaetales bacterium]|nr:hypothetical protein [Spirochaetales bacterium]